MSDDLSGFSLMDLFRSEADGQVAALSEGLIGLESQPQSAQAIEPLMRAAHSLKGAARIVGLEPAVRVAHSLEDAFVAAQRGDFVIGGPHVDVMLRAVDLLGRIALLDEAQAAAWEQENETTLTTCVAELDGLRTLAVVPASPEVMLPTAAAPTVEATIEEVAAETAPPSGRPWLPWRAPRRRRSSI